MHVLLRASAFMIGCLSHVPLLCAVYYTFPCSPQLFGLRLLERLISVSAVEAAWEELGALSDLLFEHFATKYSLGELRSL